MFDGFNLLVIAPVINIQVILDGIFIGAVFALCAYGLALVWGVMNVKNLAQGDFVIMGGYLAFALYKFGTALVLNLPVFVEWIFEGQEIPWLIGIRDSLIMALTFDRENVEIFMLVLSLPLVTALMFGFGYCVYYMMIKRVIHQDLFVSLLATFGLSLLLQQALNLIFGPEVQIVESNLPVETAFGGFVTIPMVKVLSLVLASVLAIIVVVFMKKSRMGQAIRATAQDARAARVLGIDTDRIYAFTFSLNAAICGATGVLVAMIWVIQPFYGIIYSVRAFAIVTAAGLGNLAGVIGTGFGLGVVEQYTGIVFGAEYQVATAVVILLAVLVFRQIQMRRHRQVVR